MATSISKAQAKALSDGFLNTLGQERSGLRVENTLSELIILAGDLVGEMQSNLNKADRVSTGALSSSFKVLNPERVAGNIQVDVEALYYYKFIDAGVKGTKSGSSSKGYSYKDKIPPVNVIRKWVLREGLKHTVDKYNVTKRETRRAKLRNSIRSLETSTKTISFLISRSIFRKGLKRTNFFSKAVRVVKAKAKQQMAAGFRLDIINSIPKKL